MHGCNNACATKSIYGHYTDDSSSTKFVKLILKFTIILKCIALKQFTDTVIRQKEFKQNMISENILSTLFFNVEAVFCECARCFGLLATVGK